MNGLASIVSTLHQRVGAQEQRIKTLEQTVQLQAEALKMVSEVLKTPSPLLDVHTQQITKLATMIMYLGIALTSAKALTPRQAAAVLEAVARQGEPDEHELARRLLGFLDFWMQNPSLLAHVAVGANAPKLVLAVDNG